MSIQSPAQTVPRYRRMEQVLFVHSLPEKIRILHAAIEERHIKVALTKIQELRNQIGNLFGQADKHREQLDEIKGQLQELIGKFSNVDDREKVRQMVESI